MTSLVSRCCQGDSRAQRQLYEHYKVPLFNICLRYARDRAEAQDFLQEAFLAIFRDLAQYRGSGSLEGWLRRVTVRSILQHLRRKNPLRFAEDYSQMPSDFACIRPDQEMNCDAILALVQQLPLGYRTVFNLRCVEEYEYAEIATLLGIEESSVRSQYARACRHLRQMLGKLMITPAH